MFSGGIDDLDGILNRVQECFLRSIGNVDSDGNNGVVALHFNRRGVQVRQLLASIVECESPLIAIVGPHAHVIEIMGEGIDSPIEEVAVYKFRDFYGDRPIGRADQDTPGHRS